MSSSNSIFIASADNLLGVWIVRNILKKQVGTEAISHVYAGVYSSRSPRAHELFTLGATVIEMTPGNEQRISELIKSTKGTVVIPPLESRANWYEDMEKCFQCLEKASPQQCVLVSSMAVTMADNIKEKFIAEEFKKMISVEQTFQKLGGNKKWSILRLAPAQEFMLHYSRLIQETGTLMLPTGSGKCSYVSLDDVSFSIISLITKGGHGGTTSGNIQQYTLTGPEPLDGKQLVERLNRNVEAHIGFQEVDMKMAERYLRTEFREQSIALVYLYIGTFELIKMNKLASTSEDVKKITNKDPKKVDVLFKEFAQLFRP